MTQSVSAEGTLRFSRVALIGLAVGVLLMVGTTWHWFSRHRAELMTQFSEQRLAVLRGLAQEVTDDLDDVADFVHFVGRLLSDEPIRDDQRLIFKVLLRAAEPYHTALIYDAGGNEVLRVTDPRDPPLPAAAEDQVEEIARQVLASTAARLRISPAVVDADSWYRVFATPIRVAGDAGEDGALALVVDTYPLKSKLQYAAADPATKLLVIGPHGVVGPLSTVVGWDLPDPPNKSLVGQVSDPLRQLLVLMRQGASGVMHLSDREARRLGLERANVSVAYCPIQLGRGPSWQVATFTSFSVLRERENEIVLRLVLVSLGIALTLLALGTYLLRSMRHDAVLRERLHHARELAHLNEKARKVLEHMPAGAIVLDAQGRVTDDNTVLAGTATALRRGASLAEALPQALPSSVTRLQEIVEQARTSRQSTRIIREALTLFGATGHYAVHAVPFNPPSVQADVLLVIDDQTPLKAMETQLLRAEKLTTVGILAAGVAHEVGTPLGVVRGRAEYILDKLGDDHAQARGLSVIIEQIDRIARVIRELLDFSRMTTPAVTAVDMQGAIERCIELLRYEFERRQLTPAVRVPPGLPPVRAHLEQLQQVLVNLLLNACDACAAGGEIAVCVSLMAPPADLACLQVEIRDTGCGIAPSDLHRVFDPFFTTKRRGQGTGLGLAIVAQIVRNHGAEIDIISRPAVGTQVSLYWPLFVARKEDDDGEGAHSGR